jgi:hypothetical protein
MTQKGEAIFSELLSSIPAETSLTRCSIALGKFNYVILLKKFGFAVKSGIEQRDATIKMRAKGATTLLFKDNKLPELYHLLLVEIRKNKKKGRKRYYHRYPFGRHIHLRWCYLLAPILQYGL